MSYSDFEKIVELRNFIKITFKLKKLHYLKIKKFPELKNANLIDILKTTEYETNDFENKKRIFNGRICMFKNYELLLIQKMVYCKSLDSAITKKILLFVKK